MRHDVVALELNEDNFEKEVIERSHETPVVVDFWAEWCGPCKSLAPMLEAAVAARPKDVLLGKVDVDEIPNLAARYNVRGIPTVKAFYQGAIVEEFTGLQDSQGVGMFLDRVCPSPEERALAQAEAFLAEESPAKAEALLQSAVISRRHRSRASMLLAKAAVAKGDFSRAKAHLGASESVSPLASDADHLFLRLELLEVGDARSLEEWRLASAEDTDSLELLWGVAARLYKDEAYEDALAGFLEIVKKDRSFRDDGARKAMLALFDHLGSSHELCGVYRRKLQIYI